MFLNPIMLAGLGGAAVPLVLHLLSRARYRSIDWGAMMFLQDADARQRQSTKLKQLVLLLMRMAIVALLAMALARPVVRGKWGPLAQEGRLTAVIVIDRSASMGYDENGRSRLDLAREAVLQILSTLRPGDQVSLVLLGDEQSEADLRPVSDLQAIAARVNDLKVSAAQANLVDALSRAADVFDRHEKLNRELYLVCDHQALNWKEADEAFAAVWRDRLSKAGGSPPRFFVIPVGGGASDNIAIQSLELINPPAIKDQPAQVEIQVRNFGPVPRSGLPLTLSFAGQEVLNTTVNLAPDSTASVRASVKFPQAGSQVLSAVVKSSGLTVDDRFDAVIDAVDPVKVLLVSGDERGDIATRTIGSQGLFRSESDFLRLALAPYQFVQRPGPDPAVVTVMPVEKWTDLNLQPFQVVILANVSQFTSAQARALEQFVYGGGGLLIAPGNLCRVDSYNTLLYRDGSGILPATLEPAGSYDSAQPTALLGLNLTHPVLRFLKGRPDPVPSATIGRYFPATPRKADARVLASYVTGQPFLTEISSGRGRVLLLTTPLDADWSTLPLSNFYLPFVQSAVRYLSAGASVGRNLAPGQPIVAALDQPPDGDGSAALLLPDGQLHPLQPVLLPQRCEFRHADTSLSGQYVLQYKIGGADRAIHFVVQTPRDESDLTPLPASRWRELAGAFGFNRIDTNRGSIAAALGGARAGRELWPTLLAGVFALSMLELMLARIWSQEQT